MQKKALIDMWVTILGGWFGLHKFLNREIGSGILYFFTGGLFCFGWIIDSAKAIKAYLSTKNFSHKQQLMPQEAVDMISKGNIAALDPDSNSDIMLIMSKGEKLYYIEQGSIIKHKTITTGYKRTGHGYSFRITKGISTHVGGGNSMAIRETTTIVHHGIIYLTNKRIVYTSKDAPFDIPLSKITSISSSGNNTVMIQSDKKVYDIKMATAETFVKAFHILRSRT